MKVRINLGADFVIATSKILEDTIGKNALSAFFQHEPFKENIALNQKGEFVFQESSKDTMHKIVVAIQERVEKGFGRDFTEQMFESAFEKIKTNHPAEVNSLIDILDFLPQSYLTHERIKYFSQETLQKMVLQQTKELQTMNTNLEQTVAERTRDLAESSKDLEKAKTTLEIRLRALGIEKEKLDAVISSIEEGVFAINTDGVLFLFNNAAEDLLGFTKDEVLGLPFEKFIVLQDKSGKDVAPKDSPIFNVLKNPRRIALRDFVLRKKDGSFFSAAFTVTPVYFKGEMIGGLTVFHDITREQELDRTKSSFISVAAHQLRTPLSAIKWVLDTILHDSGVLTAQQRSFLERGYNTNERMIRVVNDLLDLARMEEGRSGYVWSRVPIQALMQEMDRDFQLKAESRGISYKLFLPKKPPFVIIGDPQRLQIIFENLFDNAINYTPSGGNVEVRVEKKFDTIEINFYDTGIGISKEDAKKLFTQFFRSEQAVKMQTAGSGLGLYLARAISRHHGGDITVASRQGGGSIFTVLLPLRFTPNNATEQNHEF